MKQEEIIHIQVCRYIKNQYPCVIFTSEPSGLRLPIGLAKKLKAMRSGSKLPDIWIMEMKNGYGGMFIELKSESILNKKGNFKTPHIEAQNEFFVDLLNNQ
jgi:hypothetical protein